MAEVEAGGAVASIGAIICIAAIAVVASIEVDKDGKVKFDEKLLEEINKTLTGAYMASLDSGTSFDINKALSDYWGGKVSSLACGDNTGGGLTEEQKNANAHYIYYYLADKGWSKNAICGLLGNMEGESGLNPDSWEEFDVIAPRRGYGLVQWTPPTKYLDWAEFKGNNDKEKAQEVDKMGSKELMDNQLEFITYQLNNTDQWGPTTGYGSPYSMSAKDYIKCDNYSPSELALVWRGSFEKPGTDAAEAKKRAENAEKWAKILPDKK